MNLHATSPPGANPGRMTRRSQEVLASATTRDGFYFQNDDKGKIGADASAAAGNTNADIAGARNSIPGSTQDSDAAAKIDMGGVIAGAHELQ